MAVYIFLMAVVVIFGIVLVQFKPTYTKKLAYIIVVFSFMFIISALRYGLGNDYYSYIYIFREVKKASFIELFNLGYEPGFLLVTKLISLVTADTTVMYIIYALIILIPTAYIIFRHSENIWLSTSMFISLTFFYCSLSFIRQAIAVMLILAGYRYFKEQNHFMSLLFIFFACLFHSTVIVMIPIYFIAVLIKPTKITVPIYGAITLIVYIFSWQILELAVTLLPQYKNYLNLNFITDGYRPVYIILPTVIMLLALAAHFTGYGKSHPKESSIFTNFAIFNFIIWLISTKHFVLERFSMYIYIMMIMFIPSIAKYYYDILITYLAKRKNPDTVVVYDCTVHEYLANKRKKKSFKVIKKPLDEDKQRILDEIMAEDAVENDAHVSDLPDENDKEYPDAEQNSDDIPAKRQEEKYKADERYLPQNYCVKKQRNCFVSFIRNPITVYSVFMAITLGFTLWYNYFGLTVGNDREEKKGFHGVTPYRSIIPAVTKMTTISNEEDDNKLLRDEEHFQDYLLRIAENDNYTALIVGKGDINSGLNNGILPTLKMLGFEKLIEADSSDRYVAVIQNGKVAYEEISKSDIKYSFELSGFKTTLESKNNQAIIKMGSKDFSLNEKGINIAVYDDSRRAIVDKVRFKTYYVMLSATRD